jgi:hypothetical protein
MKTISLNPKKNPAVRRKALRKKAGLTGPVTLKAWRGVPSRNVRHNKYVFVEGKCYNIAKITADVEAKLREAEKNQVAAEVSSKEETQPTLTVESVKVGLTQ